MGETTQREAFAGAARREPTGLRRRPFQTRPTRHRATISVGRRPDLRSGPAEAGCFREEIRGQACAEAGAGGQARSQTSAFKQRPPNRQPLCVPRHWRRSCLEVVAKRAAARRAQRGACRGEAAGGQMDDVMLAQTRRSKRAGQKQAGQKQVMPEVSASMLMRGSARRVSHRRSSW
jgi:hypothetical protein